MKVFIHHKGRSKQNFSFSKKNIFPQIQSHFSIQKKLQNHHNQSFHQKLTKVFQKCNFTSSKNQKERIIYSGIQPTGNIHLGNYLGAIQNWITLQKEKTKNDKLIISVVDLHALASISKRNIWKETLNIGKILLATGIDPSQSHLYVQSHIREHAHLSWLLSSITNLSKLTHMIQFKEKIALGFNPTVALQNYPILMASDILLFKTTEVPVGYDQVQHLELTRDIVTKMNNFFPNCNFPIPKTLLGNYPRIMSLTDPIKKMSKSEASERSRICIVDSPEEISEKIKKAQTDSVFGISFNPQERPGVSNLVLLFSSLTNESPQNIAEKYSNMSTSKFKSDLIEQLVETLNPIQKKLNQISDSDVIQIFENSSKQLQPIANETIHEIEKLLKIREE